MCKSSKGDTTVVDLVFDIGITHDWSCHKLRKHSDIHSQIKRIILSLNLAAINVYHIGDGLKREKGNANRQCKVEFGYEFLTDRTIDVIGKKSLVFVEAKNP